MSSPPGMIRMAGLAMVLFAAGMWGWDYLPIPGPGPNPDPAPIPAPSDSPFPSEGFFLLITGDSSDLDGTAVVAKAENIRKEPGLESRWADYGDDDLNEPWHSAVDWAEKKSGGKPYFVGRHGNKTVDGPLTGSVDEMHKTLTTAVEGLR